MVPCTMCLKTILLRFRKFRYQYFTGLYTDWICYRNLFQALVLNRDPPLPKAAQLYFLQTRVKGEANTLVKSIQLSDANFDVAWKKLLDRYENSRHIIDSYLTK